METKNIMIVGVGGQGTLLASKLLGRILLENGYDVTGWATACRSVRWTRSMLSSARPRPMTRLP